MLDFLFNNIFLLKCDLFSAAEYKLISEVYHAFLLIVPAFVVVLCTVDIAKAVIAQDDSAIKKAQGNAIKRIIAGVILFFIPIILNLILSAIDTGKLEIDLGSACVEKIAND